VLVQDGHERKAYDITGPQAIGPQEVAALAAELGGRPVEVVSVDDDALVAGMIENGVPDAVARILLSFVVAAREGFLDSVSSAVEDLTGKSPTSLRDVVTAARQDAASV
jgi:NAD(P)H dehydrogenase (quinone)